MPKINIIVTKVTKIAEGFRQLRRLPKCSYGLVRAFVPTKLDAL